MNFKDKRGVWVLVGLIALLIVLAAVKMGTATQPPSIASGVTKKGAAKLDDYDGVKIKLNIPDGKYVAFTTDGKVYEAHKVKDGKYTYTDIANKYEYDIKAYALDEKPEKGDKIKKYDTIGSTKFSIPVENISSDDDDDDSDSESSTDTDYSDDTDDTDDSVSEDPSTKTYRTDITYDQLARDPDKYKDEDFTMTGEVAQVLEDDDSDTVQLRVAINGDYDDMILVEYDSDIMDGKRVLEDDKVTFSGTSLGTTTYESTMGGDITIPAATVDKLTDYGEANY